jgi:hypothetical protein
MPESVVGSSSEPGFVAQPDIDRVINGDTSIAAVAARVTIATGPAVLAMAVGGPVVGAIVFGLTYFIPKVQRIRKRQVQLQELKDQGFVPQDARLREVRDFQNMLKT